MNLHITSSGGWLTQTQKCNDNESFANFDMPPSPAPSVESCHAHRSSMSPVCGAAPPTSDVAVATLTSVGQQDQQLLPPSPVRSSSAAGLCPPTTCNFSGSSPWAEQSDEISPHDNPDATGSLQDDICGRRGIGAASSDPVTDCEKLPTTCQRSEQLNVMQSKDALHAEIAVPLDEVGPASTTVIANKPLGEGGGVESDAATKGRLQKWLLHNLNNNLIQGLEWMSSDRKIFKIPWRRKNNPQWNMDDFSVFKAWELFNGRPADSDYTGSSDWKTRLRCAMRKQNIVEVVSLSSMTEDANACPYKAFKFCTMQEAERIRNVRNNKRNNSVFRKKTNFWTSQQRAAAVSANMRTLMQLSRAEGLISKYSNFYTSNHKIYPTLRNIVTSNHTTTSSSSMTQHSKFVGLQPQDGSTASSPSSFATVKTEPTIIDIENDSDETPSADEKDFLSADYMTEDDRDMKGSLVWQSSTAGSSANVSLSSLLASPPLSVVTSQINRSCNVTASTHSVKVSHGLSDSLSHGSSQGDYLSDAQEVSAASMTKVADLRPVSADWGLQDMPWATATAAPGCLVGRTPQQLAALQQGATQLGMGHPARGLSAKREYTEIQHSGRLQKFLVGWLESGEIDGLVWIDLAKTTFRMRWARFNSHTFSKADYQLFLEWEILNKRLSAATLITRPSSHWKHKFKMALRKTNILEVKNMSHNCQTSAKKCDCSRSFKVFKFCTYQELELLVTGREVMSNSSSFTKEYQEDIPMSDEVVGLLQRCGAHHCTHCLARFDSRDLLQQHCQAIHTSRTRSKHCEHGPPFIYKVIHANSIYLPTPSLSSAISHPSPPPPKIEQAHAKVKITNQVCQHKCMQCDSTFSTNMTLYEHYQQQHLCVMQTEPMDLSNPSRPIDLSINKSLVKQSETS